jgi:hypothetical protein
MQFNEERYERVSWERREFHDNETRIHCFLDKCFLGELRIYILSRRNKVQRGPSTS